MQTATWDVICALDVCVDMILRGDTVPEFGQKEKLVEDYTIEMGGSCAIFACQCAKLGLRTLGVGMRGNDAFGEIFESTLRTAGVDTGALEVHRDIKTGLGLALCTATDRAILTYLGSICALSHNTLREKLCMARHLHIGSYFLMENLRPHMLDMAKEAKALGLSVSLDTNWDPDERWEGVRELLPYIDIFLPNEQELLNITNCKTPKEAVQLLLPLTPLILVKQGLLGATAYARDGQVLHAPPFPVQCVDAIGAGDSFDAGFVTMFLKGEPLFTCLRAGCACGSMSVRCAGGTAGQCDMQTLNALLIAPPYTNPN